ncbi:uncharacterized protein LOC103313694 [Tribolium castaneum]|uniref:ADFb like protein n=1 Tax=Tribolium castaneum TaxID=7070 RepID=D6WQM8_TRICA|nr:PREDICTED: uncharacterized protein LOC103313694 [Tribolium castaneum]EFA07530.1 ADFb like protein [Tribolium castaneum]|eukprot:XP_008195863.1 PREDICTED: uncharacterized protein LOC103313694 [Tribolium castaneum]
MKTLCVVVFVGIVAAAHASLIGLGHGGVDSAAILAGPSGTVSRTGHGIIAGPAAIGVGHVGVGVVAAAPLLVPHHAAQLGLELSVPAGSGLEGQWIPDVNEKLHDDGSYKPHVYGW